MVQEFPLQPMTALPAGQVYEEYYDGPSGFCREVLVAMYRMTASVRELTCNLLKTCFK